MVTQRRPHRQKHEGYHLDKRKASVRSNRQQRSLMWASTEACQPSLYKTWTHTRVNNTSTPVRLDVNGIQASQRKPHRCVGPMIFHSICHWQETEMHPIRSISVLSYSVVFFLQPAIHFLLLILCRDTGRLDPTPADIPVGGLHFNQSVDHYAFWTYHRKKN